MVILEQIIMIMIRHVLLIVDKNYKGLNLLIKLSNTEFFELIFIRPYWAKSENYSDILSWCKYLLSDKFRDIKR